ncbi:MAG TPA: PQQ-binding-like beta-propeller repeat protein [Sphingobacterium sp.]|nr:PQQ-binding-like beta-propeller repeat protein [Sphingobacterium sp.]
MRNVKLFMMGIVLTLAFISCSKDNGDGDGNVGEPSIDFSYTPEAPVASTSITFTAIINQGSSNITSWKWSFGNSTGATSTQKDPSFIYHQEGTFEVQLEGTDAAGKKATVKKTITVQPDPVFEFPAELVWTLENPTDIGTFNDATRPLIGDDGVVYYVIGGTASSASKLVAVTDAGTNAQVKWEWAPGFGLRAAPSMGADGNLYQTGWHVGTTVNKINATNGSPLWGVDAGNSGSSNSTPAIDAAGNIYVASRITASAGGIFSYDSNGNVRWSILAATGVGATYSSPAISKDGSTVYFYNTATGNVRAYHTADGTEKWSAPVQSGTGLGTSMSIDSDGTIYVTNDTEVLAVRDNGSTGSLKWKVESLLGPNSSGVVIGTNGDLYVGTKEGLKALNPTTGAVKWTYPAPLMEECVPAVDKNGNIYFGSGEGKFLIVDANGELQKQFTVGEADAKVHSPVIGDNGNVYVEVSDKGKVKLCKIAVEGGGPANSPWPMKGQNRKHTGLAK